MKRINRRRAFTDLEMQLRRSLKYKTALSVAYGAGLRASEVVALKVSDVDSLRMVIRVEQGKGRLGNMRGK